MIQPLKADYNLIDCNGAIATPDVESSTLRKAILELIRKSLLTGSLPLGTPGDSIQFIFIWTGAKHIRESTFITSSGRLISKFPGTFTRRSVLITCNSKVGQKAFQVS